MWANKTPKWVTYAHAMTRIIAGTVLAGGLIFGSSVALADAPPPTEGGNGAGSSGQCTGPQDDRPASCQSQGGPGDP